jgi:cation diffusion facilitator CzcD-associated flavoprotein CzcO
MSNEYDAVVVGAGFAGVGMLLELRRRGISATLLEKGTGPGGTWYWNRYPGARCDSPAWVYCFLGDDELLQEWEYRERFPGQASIEAYFNHVVERYGLLKDMQFDTTVVSASYEEDSNRWRLFTEASEEFFCTYFISATGLLHVPVLPSYPGVESFGGESYLTGQWPKEPVDFVGKRVAIIGTGASGAQALPVIAEDAAEVTVFQRTANYVLPARNEPVSRNQLASIRRQYGHIKQLVANHPFALSYELPNRTFEDTPPERHDAIFERAWELGDFRFIFATFDDLVTNREANDAGAEFVRNKIRKLVNDPQTAETLCPKDHPIFSKRPPVAPGYYEAYNRDNVSLVDLRSTRISEVTPRGLQLSDGTELDFDMIVYALGFDAGTGSLARIDCRGRDGRRLRDHWESRPQTSMGIAIDQFPNLFMLSGPGSHFSNFPPGVERQAHFIATLMEQISESGHRAAEPTREAVERWSATLDEIMNATLISEGAKVGSWFQGSNVPGKPTATYFFLGGAPMYFQILSEEMEAGFPSFAFDSARGSVPVG